MATVSVEWNGKKIDAFRPDPIADARFELGERATRRTERAAAELRRLDERFGEGSAGGALLLLRAEAMASCALDGVEVDVQEVAVAEARGPALLRESPPGAAWAADLVSAIGATVQEEGRLDEFRFLRWHRRLLRAAPDVDRRRAGRFRDTLAWSGGSNPKQATHVGAPADLVPGAVDDLLAFVTRTDVDPVTQAAIAQAQLEAVWPFIDGNALLGRVLAAAVLTRRLELMVPIPLSVASANEREGRRSAFESFREGKVAPWVSWFAGTLEAAAGAAHRMLDGADALRNEWAEAVNNVRSDAAAHRLVTLLPDHPAVNAPTVADMLGVSRQAGHVAVLQLAERDVLTEIDGPGGARGRPSRWFVAPQPLRLVTDA